MTANSFGYFYQYMIFRKEAGNCKICWFADAATDIKISKVAIADAVKVIAYRLGELEWT